MNRRRVPLLALLALSACGSPPAPAPEPTTEVTAPYILGPGGHGPFVCTAQIPPWAFADIYSSDGYMGTCERWFGDWSDGSAHVGARITIGSPHFAVHSIHLSPQFTAMTLCAHTPTGPTYAPCSNQTGPAPIITSGSIYSMPFTPQTIILGYFAYCPYVANHYAAINGQQPPYPGPQPYPTFWHWCAGDYTPYDGSQLPTVVATDGFVSPGLPFGNPVNLPDPLGTHVECAVDLSLTGTPNPAPAPGGNPNLAVAVYSCP